MPGCSENSFPLVLAAEGERVKIVLVRGGGSLRERLLGMGLGLGEEIVILRKQDGGAVLVGREENRLVLGGGMAHKINVIRC